MGVRFISEFVYIFDQNNTPHFVQYCYNADLGDSYRKNIYLENKSYCVHDLYLTDEVETEGEFLPYVKENEWREFFEPGPSANVSTILAEAGLTDISVSKLVFVYLESSSHFIMEYNGFVSTAEGVEALDPEILAEAISLARAKTASPAEQEELVVNRIIQQV